MAANKFATMLHKNTNKITMILIYAVLEWTLICLLLLNSLFSHMIVKFANYFGLKPPCFWCSNKNLQRDLLCECHSREVSRLGFCESHQKLAESKGMCGDCSVSVQDFHGFSLLPWMKEVKMIENGEEIVLENGDEKCYCCGVSTFGSPYIVIKSSWDHLIKEAEKGENSDGKRSDFEGSMCEEEDEGVEVDDKEEKDLVLENGILEMKNGSEKELVLENGILEMKDGSEKDLVLENGILEMKNGSEKDLVLENEILEMKDGSEKDLVLENGILEEKSERVMKDEGVQVDLSMETLPKHLEFFIDFSGNGLVPIELIDSMAEEDPKEENLDDEKKEKSGEESKFSAVMESMEIEEDDNSLVFYAKDCFSESEGYYAPFPKSSQQSKQVQILDSDTVSEEYSQMQINETEAEADVSIGTEIPDLDIADDLHCSNNEHPSTSCTNFLEIQDHGGKQDQEQTIELRALSIDLSENAMSLNEPEEEKVPDTPNSLDRKKDCGSEESLDGSVMSELDGLDPVSAIERLKSALKSERKALHVLYTELEEERSASAVAANQTMAMINRLQEEKAAMQMEAVQYQRMMDEQSEYDQEALQLLNEVMVKREKERQEIEKELEVYRKRVLEYEAKEKFALVLKRSKDNGSARSAFSSVSCSNGEEESDGMSIDLNQEAKEDERFYGGNNDHNTPIDDVVNLEDSLVDFEEERMAILEQLKVLEEKLITMDCEEDLKGEMNGHYSNGHANGYGKDRKMLSSMGKSLLPLFDDAISDENGDHHVHENGFYSNGDTRDDDYDLEKKRVGVEEELDCLHERLQALEADREFLKHCISSLKKGDKGMDLLQEILQHLRDLRNVDLRVRNLSDGCLV